LPASSRCARACVCVFVCVCVCVCVCVLTTANQCSRVGIAARWTILSLSRALSLSLSRQRLAGASVLCRAEPRARGAAGGRPPRRARHVRAARRPAHPRACPVGVCVYVCVCVCVCMLLLLNEAMSSRAGGPRAVASVSCSACCVHCHLTMDKVGAARFRAPEILFSPDQIGEECEGG
jgi:hypothetical protein